MLDWEALKKEYEDLVKELPSLDLDQKGRASFQRKVSRYAEVLSFHDKLKTLDSSIAEYKVLLSTATPDFKELYNEEISSCEAEKKLLNTELDELLYPADKKGTRNVILEIRAGAGGQEAALFAGDLFKMYSNYAIAKGWEVSIIEANDTSLGGYKDLVAYIKGRGVYSHLKYESGVHRVQRVPTTETQGRVHTSTVTVAVLPEAEDVEININAQDLRIDTYRSSGAGGQHVNTTDSAIRITHIPTGLVVTCQDERSQTKNKAKALKTLGARLLHLKESQVAADMAKQRKEQVGSGDRSEKIRTYNFPQNRITDHRVEQLTLKKLDMIMQGDLDDLIDPLMQWDAEQKRASGSIFES